MFFYGIIILLVGLALLAAAAVITIYLHRRFDQPYALLSVGILTYILALIAQYVLLGILDRALLGILPVGALAVGLLAGFTEEFARLFGFQVLARSTTTRPQALMIGAGHGFTLTIYAAILAVGLGVSLLGYGSDRPDDFGTLLSGALAEALNGILPVVMHMALSWIVLQVFLRGQLYWLFLAIFVHAVAEIMAILLGPDHAWMVVIWRMMIALISLIVIIRLDSPNYSDIGF
jgi:uncharacterized membrane protein YhfC